MSSLDNLSSFAYFLPEIALVAGILLVILWDLVSRGITRLVGVVGITLMALITSGLIAGGCIAYEVPPHRLFNGLLAFDAYASLFRTFFASIAAVIVVFATPSPEAGSESRSRRGSGEFFALLLMVTLGLNLMAMSRNLLMIYLSLELVSVISFVLAGFKIDDRRASEGALKYVIYGGTASGVMLYGMSWLYGATRSLDLGEIASYVVQHSYGDRIPLVLVVSVICILAGFGYKISAAPFHMWTPDVYEGAPTSITAFLSVGPKAAGFAVIARFFAESLKASAGSETSPTPWAVIIGAIAMLTMVIGNFTALHQPNVKRMLAYSSISHAGTMLLGICVFDDTGVRAVVFYIITYALMNLGAFLVVAAVAERHHGREELETYRGLGSRAPVLAASMALFLFSLAGLPPFAGFIGKFYIFAALLNAGGTWNWALAAVGVINSVISLFYYARVVRAMYLTKPDEPKPVMVRTAWSTATIALAIPTLLLGVYWAPVYDLVARSVSMGW